MGSLAFDDKVSQSGPDAQRDKLSVSPSFSLPRSEVASTHTGLETPANPSRATLGTRKNDLPRMLRLRAIGRLFCRASGA
jgi:hypothetical protein